MGIARSPPQTPAPPTVPPRRPIVGARVMAGGASSDGGTPEGNRLARMDAWPWMTAFLAASLTMAAEKASSR